MINLNGNSLDKWIFLLKLRNRAGVLLSLTSLFADRDVSIESLTAHASSGLGTPYGTAIPTFAASAAKKDYLARLLGRLDAVHELTEYRYEDAEHARKSALARVTLPADLLAALPPASSATSSRSTKVTHSPPCSAPRPCSIPRWQC